MIYFNLSICYPVILSFQNEDRTIDSATVDWTMFEVFFKLISLTYSEYLYLWNLILTLGAKWEVLIVEQALRARAQGPKPMFWGAGGYSVLRVLVYVLKIQLNQRNELSFAISCVLMVIFSVLFFPS